MANVNFSNLTSITSANAGDQVLIRLNNSLSGASGFARISKDNFNKRTRASLGTLSATGTINTNALSANEFNIALSGVSLSATFAAPTNAYDAQVVVWNVRYTTNVAKIILAAEFRTPLTTLNWTTSANRMDIFAAKYDATDSKWDVISFLPGYLI